MAQVTFITPYVIEHEGLLARCIQSVRGQTVPSLHIMGLDEHRHGAGYVRNALLKKVETPYVVFLDADDTVHPRFVERALSVIADGEYVYTGWQESHRKVIPAPPNAIWKDGTWHVITTLLPTDIVKRAGGFDPNLASLEDRDFYLRLIREYCICPVLLPEILFTYHDNPAGRSKTKYTDPATHEKIFRIIEGRYGHKMACCGKNNPPNNTPIGIRLENDILVQPTWRGKSDYIGRATKRHYGRVSYPTTFWCDPADLIDKQLVPIATQNYAPPIEIPDEGVIIYEEHIDELDKVGMEMGLMPKPIDLTPITPVPEKPNPSALAKKARGKK